MWSPSSQGEGSTEFQQYMYLIQYPMKALGRVGTAAKAVLKAWGMEHRAQYQWLGQEVGRGL